MKPSTIVCPKCQNEISIDEALAHRIQEELESKLRQEFNSKLEADKAKWEKEEKEKMWQKAQAIALERANEQKDKELLVLKEENSRKDKELAEARELELKFRQERNKFEDEKKAFELTKQRQLDEERNKIRQETADVLLKEHQLQDAQKDKQLEDMRKKIDELQLKVNLSSQQLQGEILELEIETTLRTEYPLDGIVPVAKGVNGADVLQKVRDQNGRFCGTIVWESKRTKNWSEGWVKKLKEDMLRVKGDVAVLISTALPDGVKSFGYKDGIYVTSFETFVSLSFILRKALIEQQIVKSSVVGKNEKMEMVYNYVLSNEFGQRVEAIAEAFMSMKVDLENEKKVFARLWAKREKEIERVIQNTVSIHGELQGLVGSSIAEIPSLEIESLASETDGIDQNLLFGEVEAAQD